MIWNIDVLHASVTLVMPSPGKDEGGVMRIIRLGDILFAAVSAETRVERDVELENKVCGIRREASARLLPTACRI